MQFMTLIFLYPIRNAIISLQIMNSAKSSILGPSQLNHSLHFAHLCSFVSVWIVLWNLFNKYLLSNYFEQGSGAKYYWGREEGIWRLNNNMLISTERLRRHTLLSHHLNEDRQWRHQSCNFALLNSVSLREICDGNVTW